MTPGQLSIEDFNKQKNFKDSYGYFWLTLFYKYGNLVPESPKELENRLKRTEK